MINMDMVGRLNDSSKTLTIGGYGTSPAWSTVIGSDYKSMHIRFDSSGTGPSDHTAFYQKNIPVLFYFTGLHSDYHKPSDDADKINYNGEVLVIDQVMNVIESLDKQPKLAFAKTRETTTTRNTKMNVSMGIMPDYTFSGSGVRADGISEGRPAQKAGLKAGDIIIQVGEFQITSMDSYMQMLGSFNKGEKAKVKFRRGNEILETTVEF
jgi:C-terminal processing protease CtpA/Prc